MISSRTRMLWPYTLLLGLIVLAYGASLKNGYVWDDRFFLIEYSWMDDWQSAWNTALSPLFNSRSYVRPLPLLSFYFEVQAVGRNPAVSHAINVLLHIACSTLVYLLASRALRSLDIQPRRVSLLAAILAALFAVHPALTEAVIWVSSRFDLMATLFMLLALWIAGLQWADGWRGLAIALCFFAAALCKESAAVLPAVLGAYEVLRRRTALSDGHVNISAAFSARNLKCFAAMFFAGLAYLLVRSHVLGEGEVLIRGNFALQEHVARFSVSLGKYLQLTLIPFINNSPQHSFYWTHESRLLDYWVYLLTAFLLILTVISGVVRRKPWGWWLAAWLISFAPVLHLIPMPIGGNVVHQRFMYFPTAVLLAFLPYALFDIPLSKAAKKASIYVLVLVILASTLMIRSIVPMWTNDLVLWQWTVQMDPNSSEARENLIWALLEHGKFDEAEAEVQKLVRDGVTTTPAVAINMGVAFYRKLELDTALYYLEMAYANQGVLLPSQKSRLASNLAATYALKGQSSRAAQLIIEAIELDPHNRVALGNLLGFCDGYSIDTSKFSEAELAHAETLKPLMIQLLDTKVGQGENRQLLCPEIYLKDGT